MKSIHSILTICLISFACHAEEPCSSNLQDANENNVPRQIASLSEVELTKRGVSLSQAKGYAILVGTMAASSALTAYLTNHLPAGAQFLSHFTSQVATLGFYVFGAPILEPLSSRIRQTAFRIQDKAPADQALLDPLELQWRETQNLYSLNAQMSRNLINAFIAATHASYFEARRAYKNRDLSYGATLFAQTAVHLRSSFREIPATEPSIANAIRAAFTTDVQPDLKFIELVRYKIETLDPTVKESETNAFYDLLLKTWLSN